jgi:GntR family transcriptional regulator
VEIDYDAKERPYEQIAAWIRERIRSGDLPSGRKIPSETSIQQETGAARTTIRRAVKLLRDEGLVETVPGHGTFVAER